LAALEYLNLLYPTAGDQTAVTRFAEACAASPVDFRAVELKNYRGLIAPFNGWAFVSGLCRQVGQALLKLELTGRLPPSLPADFD